MSTQVSRAAVEALVDRARALEDQVAIGQMAGRAPEVQAELQECLATVDACLAELPEAERGTLGAALARRFLDRPAYVPTVAPRKAKGARHAPEGG